MSTLRDPMDCNLPGSSVHGYSLGKNAEVGCCALHQRIFPTQGSNPGLPHCSQVPYHLSHLGRYIIQNVSCVLEKNVYSAFFGWDAVQIPTKLNLSILSFKTIVALIIFFLDDLFVCHQLIIDVTVVLQSPTIIVLLSISPLCLLVFAFCVQMLLCWGHIYLQFLYLLLGLFLDNNVISLSLLPVFIVKSIFF